MATSDSQLLSSMLQYAQPQAYPAIRRSEYLADALEALQNGSSQNLRTKGALAANIATSFLLQKARDRNFKELTKASTDGMSAMADALGAGLPGFTGGGGSAGPAATPPIAGGSQLPPQTQGAPMQAQPMQGGGIPMMQVPPEAVAQAQKWIQSGNPMLMKQGIDMLTKLRQQSVTPVDLPPGFAYNADGTTRDLVHKNTYVDGPKPGTQIGTDETGKKTLFDTGITGPTPPGQVFQGGANVAIPTAVGGHVMDRDYTPAELGSQRDRVIKSEEYKTAVESIKAYQAMTANATQPGGMSAYAMRDTFARAINPGAVARSGTLQAIAEARGIPDSVKGFFLNLKGDGDLDDNTKQQILNATLPFVQANFDAAQRLNQDNTDWATRHGVDPADVIGELGERPKPFTMPKPKAAAGPSTPKDGVRRPKTKAEYDAMPPGPYIAPDGSPRIKK